MRINKFIALSTGLSRRAADRSISEGRVNIDGRLANLGDNAESSSLVLLDGNTLTIPVQSTTIMLSKPVGHVCSRDGQGSPTIYDLLPDEYKKLKSIGRLDKDSSGLILLTNNGDLANQLTHPSYNKTKIYQIELNKPLQQDDAKHISNPGIELDDGISKLKLKSLDDNNTIWRIEMNEGRNRQIRRTFEKLGLRVVALKRTNFGPYALSQLAPTQTFMVVEQK